MKLKGKALTAPKPITVVIPRERNDDGSDGNIILHLAALPGYDEFDKLVKEPVPPFVTKPGQAPTFDHEDKDFKKALEDFAAKKMYYMFVKSLTIGNPDLELTKVDIQKPETWTLLDEEMREAGFIPREIDMILRAVLRANALDEKYIKEARESFFRGLQPKA